MKLIPSLLKSQSSSRLVNFISLTAFAVIIYLLASISLLNAPKPLHTYFSPQDSHAPTRLDQIVFGIGSSKATWPRRREYLKLWWNPHKNMRGCVFLEEPVPENGTDSHLLPPTCISEDTSRFRYTFRGGYRSAIRIARMVVETVGVFNTSDIKWYVFGDDDTIFFPENLAVTLSKYDHGLWYYVGSNSENYVANSFFGFDMAFGGGGFALSYPLAKVLAKVFDSCIERYPHLYGGDGRTYSCLAELGVGLSHEPGFHQFDVRGNIFGLLTSHPMTPLISFHHMELMDPIFPNSTTFTALQRLFQAAKLDQPRLLQRSVCYDRWFSWTVSVSWGYAVQIHSNHVLFPDLLPAQETFLPWKGRNPLDKAYVFNTRKLHPDPCRRPVVFFLDNVWSERDGTIRSVYKKSYANCSYDMANPRRLEEVRVFAKKLDLDIRQVKAPRRQCCEILPSSAGKAMEIAIRECKEDELIYMHP